MLMNHQSRLADHWRHLCCIAAGLLVVFPAWGWEAHAATSLPQDIYNPAGIVIGTPLLYSDILAAKIDRAEAESDNVNSYSELTLHWGQSSDLAAAALNASSPVGALGWRIHAGLGWITPWAEVSYQRDMRDAGDISNPLPQRENNHWMDVTVGAQMPLSDVLSAFASFSQNGGGPVSASEQTLYNVGISARF